MSRRFSKEERERLNSAHSFYKAGAQAALEKYAGTEKKDQKKKKRNGALAIPALALGSSALIPAAGALTLGQLGQTAINEELPAVDPKAVELGQEFARLGKEPIKDPRKFVSQYVNLGSQLTKQTAMTGGATGPLTGQQLIEKVRTGPLGNVLRAAGMHGEFDEASKEHYREFAKGPAAAMSQVAKEISPNLQEEFLGDVLGARYQAARESIRNGRVHPSLLRRNLARILGEKFNNPEAGKLYAQQLETQLAAADNPLYLQHLAGVAEGKDVGALQNELLRGALRGKGLGPSADAKTTLDRRIAKNIGRAAARASSTQQLQHALNQDLLAHYVAMKAAPSYQKAVSEGYGNMVDSMLKYRKLRENTLRTSRTLRNAGAIAGLGGLGLAGLGARQLLQEDE